ncbi:ubiquitin-conjugating enzyme E2 J1-like [Homarus americanus]|uniref:ubiquitin-conjugating enzyme E2 J1-like n=1 Tax=Homarus americanus TaxID=6706 RepID=UPI001C451028|nr:ubiquitin-conjugating enzyme E2 J1-like [Homarus americanus]
MESSYNSRCPAVKRLFREAKELHEATEEYFAQPLDDNLFEWHFTVRGPADSEFDGGVYHGRIIMPADYPMKPPNIIFLTPNGRFETNKKICLSISGHHPETWQPSWSIRTALLAIIGFMPTPANGTIGSLDYTANERAKLAKKSLEFECPQCGCVSAQLKERTSDNKELQEEAREVMGQVVVTVRVENKEGSEEPTTPVSEDSSINNSSTDLTASCNQPTADALFDSPPEPPANTKTESNMPQATSQITLPGNSASAGSLSAPAVDPAPEILMEGIAAHNGRRNPVSSVAVSSQGYLYNMILTSAIFLFIGLVMRRIFLLEGDTSEELDDVLL